MECRGALTAPVSPQTLSGTLTAQLAVEFIAATLREPLPECKLSNFDGDPFQWPKWIAKLSSAIDRLCQVDVFENFGHGKGEECHGRLRLLWQNVQRLIEGVEVQVRVAPHSHFCPLREVAHW